MIRNPDCNLCPFGADQPKPPLNVCLMTKPKPCDIMIVAEIPSQRDDEHKTLFSSKILDTVVAMFEKQGMSVYVAYAVKCKRPERTGRKQAKINSSKHVKPCAETYLRPEIAMVRPKHIVVLGANAHYAATGNPSFAPNQGQRYFSERANAWIYPTYSEAFASFKPEVRIALWNELRMYIEMIEGRYEDFKPPVHVVDTIEKLLDLEKKLVKAGRAAADTETGGPWVLDAKGKRKKFNGLQMFKDGGWVRCIQFCADPEDGGYFVPLGLAYEDDLIEGYDTVQVEKHHQVALDDEDWLTGDYKKGRKFKKVAYLEDQKVPIPQKTRFWEGGKLLPQVIEIIRRILKRVKIAWHNGKFDRKWLWMWGKRQFGRPIRSPRLWLDTQHAAHVLNENRDAFKLKRLQTQEFGIASHEIADKMTKDLSELIPYATIDTVTGLLLAEKYERDLDLPDHWKLKRLYAKTVKPMDRIYTEMELEGWPVSLSVCQAKRKVVKTAIRTLLKQLDDYLIEHNVPFEREPDEIEAALEGKGRLVLPKRYKGAHLAEIVFDHLGYQMSNNPELAYTDEGDRATSVQAFLHIRRTEFISILLKYKKAEKILTTYLRPMIQQAKYRGKLTTSYKLTIVTARSGSGKEDSKTPKGDESNLQNLPYLYDVKNCIRFEIGSVNPYSGERRVQGQCDLSQIELRGAAEFSGDPLMLWAYDNDVDLHTYRAIRNLRLDTDKLNGGFDIETWHWVLKHGEWSLLSPKVQKDARKKAKPCIAEGMRVLTEERGLVPIEKVMLADRVWDGVEWVKHDGVVYQGYKEVMQYNGLVATPDHTVYLDDGTTCSFLQASHEKTHARICVTEVGGETHRYSYADPLDSSTREFVLVDRRPVLRLRRDAQNLHGQHRNGQNDQLPMSTVTQGRREQQALLRSGFKGVGRKVRRDPSALHQPGVRCLPKLRRQGDRKPLREAGVHLLLQGASTPRDVQEPRYRSREQRRALRTGEYSLSHAEGQPQQQTRFVQVRVQRGSYSGNGLVGEPSARLSRFHSFVLSNGEVRSGRAYGGGDSEDQASERSAVYDILNAGPRHRFTVESQLVGNCNFGYLYGMGSPKFVTYAAQSYDLDFSQEEAKDVRDGYFRDHAGLPRWYKRVELTANKLGYVESMSGRRRRLPILKGGLSRSATKEQKGAYSAALRQAVNVGPQEFGAWLKYAAMIEFRKVMKAKGWYGKRMMTYGEVHDSICWWADESIAVEVGRILREIMRHPPLLDEFGIVLRVPIDADCEIGPSYGEGVVLNDLEATSRETGVGLDAPYWLAEYFNAKEKAKGKGVEDPGAWALAQVGGLEAAYGS